MILPDPTERERQLARAMHIASIFTPLWVPFVVWMLTPKEMKFLRAHSRLAAFDGIIWKAIFLLLAVISITVTIITLIHHFSTQWRDFEWSQVIWRALITLFVLGSLFIVNLVQSIKQAFDAKKGIWPKREQKLLAKGHAVLESESMRPPHL